MSYSWKLLWGHGPGRLDIVNHVANSSICVPVEFCQMQVSFCNIGNDYMFSPNVKALLHLGINRVILWWILVRILSCTLLIYLGSSVFFSRVDSLPPVPPAFKNCRPCQIWCQECACFTKGDVCIFLSSGRFWSMGMVYSGALELSPAA